MVFACAQCSFQNSVPKPRLISFDTYSKKSNFFHILFAWLVDWQKDWTNKSFKHFFSWIIWINSVYDRLNRLIDWLIHRLIDWLRHLFILYPFPCREIADFPGTRDSTTHPPPTDNRHVHHTARRDWSQSAFSSTNSPSHHSHPNNRLACRTPIFSRCIFRPSGTETATPYTDTRAARPARPRSPPSRRTTPTRAHNSSTAHARCSRNNPADMPSYSRSAHPTRPGIFASRRTNRECWGTGSRCWWLRRRGTPVARRYMWSRGARQWRAFYSSLRLFRPSSRACRRRGRV